VLKGAVYRDRPGASRTIPNRLVRMVQDAGGVLAALQGAVQRC
jgi:hypothetical protein